MLIHTSPPSFARSELVGSISRTAAEALPALPTESVTLSAQEQPGSFGRRLGRGLATGAVCAVPLLGAATQLDLMLETDSSVGSWASHAGYYANALGTGIGALALARGVNLTAGIVALSLLGASAAIGFGVGATLGDKTR